MAKYLVLAGLQYSTIVEADSEQDAIQKAPALELSDVPLWDRTKIDWEAEEA